jgi:hypothetical protein
MYFLSRLEEQHDEQHGAEDVGRVRQPHAKRIVEVVGKRLADRRAEDLDDPEVERDLWKAC